MIPAPSLLSTKKRTDKPGISASALGNSPVQYNEDGSVKVKKRLARKAELARASRRRRKAYVQNLEEKVARLSARIIELQKANANNAVHGNNHSHSVPDSTTFFAPPSYLGGPLTASSHASHGGAMEATSDMSSTGNNSTASYLFSFSNSSNNSTSALTTHTHPFLTDTDNQMDGGNENPLLTANSASGNLLAQSMLQQSSQSQTKTAVPWWLQGAAVYAVKALFRGDRRRFTVQTSNTSFAELVKTLREIYGLGGPITVSYPDDEGDTIQMTSDAELFEALRIAAAQSKPTQQSKAGPADMSTDDPSSAPAAANSGAPSFDAPMSDSASVSTSASATPGGGHAVQQAQATIVLKVFVEASELSVGSSTMQYSQNHGSVSPVTAGVAQLQTSAPSAFAPRPQLPTAFGNPSALPFSTVGRFAGVPPPPPAGFLSSPPPHLSSLSATPSDQNTPLSTASSDLSSLGVSAPHSSTSTHSSYYSQDESVGLTTLSTLASNHSLGNDFWGSAPKSNALGMRRVSSAPSMNQLLRLPAYPVPAIIPSSLPSHDPPTVLYTHGMQSSLPPIPVAPPRRDRQWLSVETPSTNAEMSVGTTTNGSLSNGTGSSTSFLNDGASLSPKRSGSPRSLSPSSLRSSIQHGGSIHDLMALASAQVNSKLHADTSPSKSGGSKRKSVVATGVPKE